MRRMALPLLILLALTAPASDPARRASDAVTAVPVRGEACATGSRAEFVRQQQTVHWSVYCPSELPDGFRLAGPDDPEDVSQLGGMGPGGDLTPTLDSLNPGGGTFITRFVGPAAAQIVVVQGAGASIYTLRDAAGNLISNGELDGAFGDLAGRLYPGDPPRVTAGDSLGYGRMIVGYGVAADVVGRMAAAMRPVDASGVRSALFSLADLQTIAPDLDWVVAWPPDPTGEDVRAPSVCGKGIDEGDRLAEAVVRFEPAGQPGAAADAGGHGPFLQQAVAMFPPGGAQRYIDRMAGILAQCATPYEQKAADGSHEADVTLTRAGYADLGDQSLVFRRSSRSPVQGADTDIALIRRGDDLAIVLRFETAPAGGPGAAADAILPYARLADAKLRALRGVPPATPTASPAGTDASPAPDASARDRVVRGLRVAPFASNYVPYDWSPDGRRIAFIGDERALYIAEAPAFMPFRLADGSASEPRWSPDGKLIAFAQQDDGIELISPDGIGSTRPMRASPPDDAWRGRIVQIYRWLDDRTIAYDAHCGSGCQMLFEMTVERPAEGSAPRTAGVVRQVPFVRTCAGCGVAGLAFHYSPDATSIVADIGTMPSLAWYDRASESQWVVVFDDDPPGTEIFREFVSWDADSRSFVYRESIGVSPFADPPPQWTYWRADPASRTRLPIPPESGGKPTGDPALDGLIAATLAGDSGALVSRLAYTTMPCVAQGQDGSPPVCEAGQQVGDPVPAFLAAGCGGGWVTPAEAERSVRGVRKPVRFVAAGAPSGALPDPSVDRRVLFAFGPGDDADGFWFDVRRGRIAGLHSTCATVADALRFITPAAPPP